MGQEASVPMDGRAEEEELEEQARAPPSTANPAPAPSSAASHGHPQHQHHLLLHKEHNKGRKLINGIMKRSAKGDKSGASGTTTAAPGDDYNNNSNFSHHTHNSELETYEYREAARAAAAGGNVYLRDNATSEDYALQKMPSQHHQQQQSGEGIGPTFYQPSIRNDEIAKAEDARKPPPLEAVAAALGWAPPLHSHQQQQQQQHPDQHPPIPNAASGNSSSNKKGLFTTGRSSARGMINSMRNLSIGNALRKQKDVQDWEKQWDEDVDDESDEEDEETAQPPLYTSAAAVSAAGTAPVSPPRHAAQAIATSLTHGVVAPPLIASGPTDVSPVRVSPAASAIGTPPSISPDWDTESLLVVQREAAGQRKPDVQMFLPMLRVLGKGSFGKVVLVQKREGKERGQLFAMKILKKSHLVKRRQIERTRTERKVLSVVNHPFIMKLHYAFQTPDKLYLVLDYCPGGELFFHLSRFRRFPERVARFYAAELLLAIGHLHKRSIIYRDLKPENVLLDADGHVKLGDFGLAKAGIQHPYEGATSMCGTPEYMAPEVLAQMGHGFCVDYWGLGMICFEMMTGLPPWYTTDRQQLFRRLKSAPLEIPSYFSAPAAACVTALLERNPRRRLGVTGIRTVMEHEFFRSISWRALYSRRVEAPVRPCEGWQPPEPVNDDLTRPECLSEAHYYPDGVMKLDANTLDTATQNFDNQFLRMPVESEDIGDSSAHNGDALEEGLEDLDENTFMGFTFDIVHDREKQAAAALAAAQEQNLSSRSRAHNYQPE